MRLFLSSRGRMNRKIAMYGVAFLLLMVGFVLGLIGVIGVGRGWAGLFACGLGMLVLPGCLGLRAAWRSGKWKYVFQFMFLYLALGVARGVASIKVR